MSETYSHVNLKKIVKTRKYTVQFLVTFTELLVDGGYVFNPVCLSVCLPVRSFVHKISQKVVDGFGRNFVESLGM